MASFYRKSALRSIFFWVIEIILVVVLAFAFARGFCRAVTVTDNAMSPTISSGQTALINSAGYILGSPKRGDVVVFRNEEDEPWQVRRIVGLPGDTVQIQNGQILVNGETYMEKKDFPAIEDAGRAEDPVDLGTGEYFVLGDNRNASDDSRNAAFGTIRRSSIRGKLWLRIAPAGSFGRIK